MARNPSLAAALLRSWLALKTWVKLWLFVLNAVFLAAFTFVPEPLAVWTLVAYVAAGPALAAIMIPQRGLTRLLGLGHLVPWTPLVAYLVARLFSDLAGPRLRVEDRPALTGYAVLLATVTLACLAFDKDRTTGADFARQRAILRESGFRTVLIETDELGSVERNADLVAKWLDRLAEREEKIIVVSASKGGPEVALALGERLSGDTSSRVKAWISVGGLLRGSPYADRFLYWPRRWFAGIALAFQGLPSSVIRDLSTGVRGPAFARLHLPTHLLTLQYVGTPLSGQIGKSTRGRYNALRSLGPNDGLTLLTDELVPGGVVVTDVSLDHYYRDAAIDLKTLALAYVVLDELERQ